MNFYALRNCTSGRWNTPFLAHSDNEAIDIIAKTVTMQNDLALIYSLDDLELYNVGYFDVDESVPVSADCIELVLVDLHKELPLPPFVRNMVDKIYKKDGESDAQ